MKKILIIDTNVFFFDQLALNQFPNSIIILPITVIKELDKYKKDPLRGPNVRSIIRMINNTLSKPTETITLINNNNDEKEDIEAYPLENGSHLVKE